ncbi:hypothetical protein [Pseudomonas sp. Pseusp97]|uniref:hypothetical protein n=1 Tax=Pseudomonas sp. Pseusp97 TaxID=3243065 RepID=UPI0039A67D3E
MVVPACKNSSHNLPRASSTEETRDSPSALPVSLNAIDPGPVRIRERLSGEVWLTTLKVGRFMTSDAKRYEGHQEVNTPVMAAPQLSEQVEGSARPTLSAGYIPIRGNASAPAGQSTDSQTVEAFESLERDLADLASACSGLAAVETVLSDVIDSQTLITGTASAEQQAADSDAAAALLDSLSPLQASDLDSRSVDDAAMSPSIQPVSHFSQEEQSIMNAQAQPSTTDTSNARPSVESAVSVRQAAALETDGVLHDVQSTLDSLAGMAHGLSQQKLEIVKMREALEERRLATLERERQLVEREERLGQLEQRLQEEKQGIERVAEHNAAVLAERSTALQALAETVDSRDRATTKRAEVLSQEQQNIDRQLNQLRARVQELDEREAGLQRQGSELADRFKQLLDAKERFGAIVKGFNETVRFNTTYSAISKTVGTGAEEA